MENYNLKEFFEKRLNSFLYKREEIPDFHILMSNFNAFFNSEAWLVIKNKILMEMREEILDEIKKETSPERLTKLISLLDALDLFLKLPELIVKNE